MYICSDMEWIAFVQIIYRTLAVYQEKNEFEKKIADDKNDKEDISNGLQCRVSLPSKAHIHSGRSERLEANGQTEERAKKKNQTNIKKERKQESNSALSG